MSGHLALEFIMTGSQTFLIQRETLQWQGFLKIFSPLIYLALKRRLYWRLSGIQNILESGWTAYNSKDGTNQHVPFNV
jgi:hypothetical protein